MFSNIITMVKHGTLIFFLFYVKCQSICQNNIRINIDFVNNELIWIYSFLGWDYYYYKKKNIIIVRELILYHIWIERKFFFSFYNFMLHSLFGCRFSPQFKYISISIYHSQFFKFTDYKTSLLTWTIFHLHTFVVSILFFWQSNQLIATLFSIWIINITFFVILIVNNE